MPFISLWLPAQNRLPPSHPLSQTSDILTKALVISGSIGLGAGIVARSRTFTPVRVTPAAAGAAGAAGAGTIAASAVTGSSVLGSQLIATTGKTATTLGLGAMILDFMKNNPYIVLGIAGIIGLIFIKKR